MELEAGVGLGGRKAVTFAGPSLKSQPMPDTISYSADLVFTIGSHRHVLVPYVLLGAGALGLVRRPGTDVLGIASTHSFLAGNAGGGVKWYAVRAWAASKPATDIVCTRRQSSPRFEQLDTVMPREVLRRLVSVAAAGAWVILGPRRRRRTFPRFPGRRQEKPHRLARHFNMPLMRSTATASSANFVLGCSQSRGMA